MFDDSLHRDSPDPTPSKSDRVPLRHIRGDESCRHEGVGIRDTGKLGRPYALIPQFRRL